jgi:hypothetical protein
MYFSKTSLWVPQIFIFLGIALMVLQLLSAMAKLYQDLVKTNIKGADKGKLSNRDGLVQKEI